MAQFGKACHASIICPVPSRRYHVLRPLAVLFALISLIGWAVNQAKGVGYQVHRSSTFTGSYGSFKAACLYVSTSDWSLILSTTINEV